MNLKSIFKEECCLILREQKKTEVLIEMVESLVSQNLAEDEDKLKSEIFYREQLMSTGIGMEIAIPHVRFKGITEPVAAIGIAPLGIDDYESIDSLPVKIVIMILVGENQHKQHIRLLSQIMTQLKEDSSRLAIIESSSPKEIFNLITGDFHA